jgi:hypothetical protein
LTGSDVVSASGTLSTTSFTSSSGAFNEGDMLMTDDFYAFYCGVIVKKTLSGGNYIYDLKNSKMPGGGPSPYTVRTTKNPPKTRTICGACTRAIITLR